MKKIFIALAVLLAPLTASAQSYAGATRFVLATDTTGAAPTNSTSIYVAGYAVGPLLQFTNAVRSSNCTGLVVSAEVTDKSKQASDLSLTLFKQNPTGSTITDHAAFTVAAGDLNKVVGVISLPAATSLSSFSANGVHYVGSIVIPVQALTAAGGCQGNIYGVLSTSGTPTFAGTTDLSTFVAVSQD